MLWPIINATKLQLVGVSYCMIIFLHVFLVASFESR